MIKMIAIGTALKKMRKLFSKKRIVSFILFGSIFFALYSTVTSHADEFKESILTDLKTAVKDIVPDSVTSLLPEGTTDEEVVIINDNIPSFTTDDFYQNGVIVPFQNYSNLDLLGRSGEAYVLISKEDMPTYERGSIQNVHPSGWHTYNTKNTWGITLPDDSFYLYNRCHIIGFQLTGIDGEHTKESLLKKNLFTGTRYMNTELMLPYENIIANYLRTHEDGFVLYKATPVYEGTNLVASGIELEALSLDEEVSFNVYVKNIQKINDGQIYIDYKTGEATYIKGVE